MRQATTPVPRTERATGTLFLTKERTVGFILDEEELHCGMDE